MALGNRLAIDIGGTFTDVVLLWRGVLYSTKVLTSHAAPAQAVLEGIGEVVALADLQLAVIGRDIELVLHGTTLATNALIERSGALTALLTTQGHRDVLEMAYENRFEQYDLNIERPAPLVPRHLRLPIVERINARGEVLFKLDTRSIDTAIERLLDAKVASIAIGFLHAYANSEHEERTAERVAAAIPGLSITLASAVCPEIREYERLSTAVANAYVRPKMSGYLLDLEQRLAAAGIAGRMLLMTSGGGLTTVATASNFPIRLVESGPAGGAILAASHARRLGLAKVLAFDMGGTTAKLSLIDNGQPQLSRAFEVDRQYRFKKGSGLPLRVPVIEMVEIGAGGGSIARFDALHRLCVGPVSAGSDPGPACYGQQGSDATVTDADLQLGRLLPSSFAGGRMPLNPTAAARTLEALGLEDATTAAYAISEVLDENMTAAARAHASEWGKGVEDRTLIAFGGAAPLHAAQLAHKLGLQQVIIPAGAGVGSALGFLVAPVAFEVVRSRYAALHNYSSRLLAEVTKEMTAEAEAVVRAAVPADVDLVVTRRAFMRYAGQGYEIAVDLGAAGAVSGAQLRALFETRYRDLYGRVIAGLDIEILSWTLSLAQPVEGQLTNVAPTAVEERPTADEKDSNWMLFDTATQQMQPASVVRRSEVSAATRLNGPSLIIEAQTTTYVPSGFTARCNQHGDLVLTYAD